MGYIEGKINRDQISFMPMSFDEIIGEDNPVRVIDAFVEMLDANALNCKYSEPKSTGRRPYNPKDMLKLYVYGYFYGIRTSRKLERECTRNVEIMWLINRLTPDFKTIADFRKDNKGVVISIFKEFSLFCNQLNLIGKEMVAIDGSKFRACNRRRKNFTKRKVEKMLEHYEQSAKKYLELLANSDDSDSDDVNIDTAKIEEKLQNAKKRIEELHLLEKEVQENGEVSVTDPDARHMSVSNNGTDIAHNVQTVVDSKYHLVVALDVTSNAADNGQLYPMAEQAKKELSVDKIIVIADKGYYNGEDLKKCEENGITAIVSKQRFGNRTGNENFAKDKFTYEQANDVYICPMGQILTRKSGDAAKRKQYGCVACNECSNRSSCTTNAKGRRISLTKYQEYYDRADKLFTENLELYKQRQMIVEHPFGTVKRALGYTYFLLKGHEKVKCESYMHFFIYNFKRVINIMGITPLIAAIKKRMVEMNEEILSSLALFEIFVSFLGRKKSLTT
ncbi:MAG: IS1182 family transposase [Oscillospiraceae bacterium]|nr:IS1182 family transposase [Oscillospiraceae bacterium]